MNTNSNILRIGLNHIQANSIEQPQTASRHFDLRPHDWPPVMKSLELPGDESGQLVSLRQFLKVHLQNSLYPDPAAFTCKRLQHKL